VCCAGLCQHGGFLGCCFGGGKSFGRTRGNISWSSHGGIRKVYECNRCDSQKVDQGDEQLFRQFLQKVDWITTSSYVKGIFQFQ
jgi:hypothetical protein